MLKWNFEVTADIGRTAPEFHVPTSCDNANIVLSTGKSIVEFSTPDCGQLIIDYHSKKESDTILDQSGKIVGDTQWRILKIWCDDILLESWFLHDCVYEPRYFAGFLEIQPDAPSKITSPYQFNFPGTLHWHWDSGNFWEWYRLERTRRVNLDNMDIDLHRWEKFVGSPELYPELVAEIKELIHGT